MSVLVLYICHELNQQGYGAHEAQKRGTLRTSHYAGCAANSVQGCRVLNERHAKGKSR
jgi:hypothetical protein